MTKLQAMKEISNQLRKERVPHHLETKIQSDGKLVLLEELDCIHLTWFLSNALEELQIALAFREEWLDIQGFPHSAADGGPIAMSERAAQEVVNFLNEVNSHAKFGCAFYLDSATNDVACSGRIPYALLERMPEYAIEMVDGIWEFFSDVGDQLMAVAKGRLMANEAFMQVIDKGWGRR